MEVILTQDVLKLGRRGEKVRVKDGYARNFLIPRKLAMVATDSNVRHFQEIMRQTRARMEKQKSSAQEMFAKLDGEHVKLTLAFGETGKAYGSVTAKDIAASFHEKGIYFDHHQVVLDRPLKEAGAHDVKIRLFEDVIASVKVWVVPEGQTEEDVTETAQAVPEPEVEVTEEDADEAASIETSRSTEVVEVEASEGVEEPSSTEESAPETGTEEEEEK